LIDLLDKFGKKHPICERWNLNAMTFVLKYVVDCETLGLQENINDTCFGHVYSKAYQYVIIDEKVYRSLRYVSIKAIQGDLQKCITCPKNLDKLSKSGPKLVWRLEFILENSIPQ